MESTQHTRKPLIKPVHGLDQVAKQNAVSFFSTNSMAYAIEFGGTSLCRAREALNQSFPGVTTPHSGAAADTPGRSFRISQEAVKHA